MNNMQSKIRLLVCFLGVTIFLETTTHAFQLVHTPLTEKTSSFVTSTTRSTTTWSIGGKIEAPAALNAKSLTSTSLQMNSFGGSSGKRGMQQHKDIVIIGAGLAGLSAALYITQIDPSRRVTIIDKEGFDKESKETTTVASFAAAGMLAPQSERLPKGKLLDLCLESRRMYPDFVHMVESLARESGDDGEQYLFSSNEKNDQNNNKQRNTKNKFNDDDCEMEPWEVGYVASGGFLAPAFAGDAVATWAPPEESGKALWLDSTQVLELEPHLHPDVIGGWWFPEDASVDARRLTCSLVAACVGAGVEFMNGKNYEVTSLDLVDGECKGLKLKNGRYLCAKSILLGNGAWMRTLLPVPIEPHKGQSLSLQMPMDRPPVLRRVLFAQDTYIVPKADGKIIIGATIEAGSYDGDITPKGMIHILSHAIQLVPGLADLPIKETWAGLRPTTPDKGPILGKTPWKNLFLAGGYWRNGVLLAPKTGQLIANLICGDGSSEDNNSNNNKENEDADVNELLSASDRELLEAFNWDRFISKDGGAKMAAATRIAAAMHPIHSRSSGAGVAAAVGTELGFYATASSASDERKKDRQALFGDGVGGDNNGGDDSALERAAQLGQQDAGAYSFAGDFKKPKDGVVMFSEPVNGDSLPFSFDDQEDDDENADMESISKTIEENNVEEEKIAAEQKHSTEDDGIMSSNHKESKAVNLAKETASLGKNNTAEGDDNEDDKLKSLYDTIQNRKSKTQVHLPEKKKRDENDENDFGGKSDPGFRIYHTDKKTGEVRVVPPFTTPADFMALIEKKRSGDVNGIVDSFLNNIEKTTPTTESTNNSNHAEVENDGYAEDTLDGYVDITDANSRTYREDELKIMRETRRSNRLGQSAIDESAIGAQRSEEDKLFDENKIQLQKETTAPASTSTTAAATHTMSTSNNLDDSNNTSDDYGEDTLDGYVDITDANSRTYREDELKIMRETRRKNRLGQQTIDESAIGAQSAKQ